VYSPWPYSAVVAASSVVNPEPTVLVSVAVVPSMATMKAPVPKLNELVATAAVAPVPVAPVTPLVVEPASR
jgi:hypothetical protein